MSQSNQKRQVPMSLREQSSQGNPLDKEYTPIRSRFFDFLMLIYGINIVNAVLYNTHWIQLERGSSFDAIAATIVIATNLFGIIGLTLFKR